MHAGLILDLLVIKEHAFVGNSRQLLATLQLFCERHYKRLLETGPVVIILVNAPLSPYVLSGNPTHNLILTAWHLLLCSALAGCGLCVLVVLLR